MNQWIKTVGAGKRRARDLTRAEAEAAMSLVISGQAEPVQIGAFLLAMRMKGESAEEMAGFSDALMPSVHRQPLVGVLDIDCHADGHRGQASLLPAVALALAALGIPVLLRGDLSNPLAQHGLPESLGGLGIIAESASSVRLAQTGLAQHGIAFLDLSSYCLQLKRLIALRPLLGVRTVAQTLAKLVSPFVPSQQVVGVFHMPYLQSTAQALKLVAPETTGFCVQAVGGLPEARGKLLRVCAVADLVEKAISLPFSQKPECIPKEVLPAGAALRANWAALSAQEPEQTRAAGVAATLLSLVREQPLESAFAACHDLFGSGQPLALAKSLVKTNPPSDNDPSSHD